MLNQYTEVLKLSMFIGKQIAMLLGIIFIILFAVYNILGEEVFNKLVNKFEGVVDKLRSIFMTNDISYSNEILQIQIMLTYIKYYIFCKFNKNAKKKMFS